MTHIRPFSLQKSGPAFGSKDISPEGRIARGLEPTGGCHVTDPQIRPNLSNERNLLNDRTPPLSPERGGDSSRILAAATFIECDLCSDPGVCRSGHRCPLFLPARIGGAA